MSIYSVPSLPIVSDNVCLSIVYSLIPQALPNTRAKNSVDNFASKWAPLLQSRRPEQLSCDVPHPRLLLSTTGRDADVDFVGNGEHLVSNCDFYELLCEVWTIGMPTVAPNDDDVQRRSLRWPVVNYPSLKHTMWDVCLRYCGPCSKSWPPFCQKVIYRLAVVNCSSCWRMAMCVTMVYQVPRSNVSSHRSRRTIWIRMYWPWGHVGRTTNIDFQCWSSLQTESFSAASQSYRVQHQHVQGASRHELDRTQLEIIERCVSCLSPSVLLIASPKSISDTTKPW